MKECNCNELGSTTFICDQMSGQCDCKSDLIVGTQCDSSKDGFFNFPNPEGKNIKGLSNKYKLIYTNNQSYFSLQL